MRVLLVAEQLRRGVAGGIGTYTRGLLAGLRSLGERRGEQLSVTLLASRGSGGWLGSGAPPDRLGGLGWPLRTSSLPSVLLTRAWDAGVVRPPGGFDLLHLASLGGPAPGRSPSVMMVHDLAWREEPLSFPARGRRWHEAALRRALDQVDRFVVPSSRTERALVAAGASAGSVVVIEHGSDHLPAPDREGARRLLSGLRVEGPFLLSVSTLEPRKNLRRLVEAYSMARPALAGPWPLLVVGPRGWGGDQVGGAEGVVLCGEVPDAVLASLYEGARCVAYVPLVEGFGFPAVEAMVARAPVVASPVPGAGGAALEVDPHDVTSIADGLVRACTDDEVRRRLVDAGSERAAALTWERAAERHVELWREVAAGPDGRAARAPRRLASRHASRDRPTKPAPGSAVAPGREVLPASPVHVSIDVSAVPERPAGAGRYVLDLVGALARRQDVAMTLISRHDDSGRWASTAPGAVLEAVAPSRRPVRLAWEQVRLPHVLRGLPVEVHHGPHYTMPEASSVPKLVTIHDLTFFDHPELHERSRAAFFRRAIRVASRKADGIVCVSEVTAARLQELLSPSCDVRVIHHGVDHARFRPEEPREGVDGAALADLGIDVPYVAFVGTIEPRKGLPTLVRAFDRVCSAHPSLSLVIAGMPAWGADELSSVIASVRHPHRIKRTGYLSHEAVPALFRRAAAVAYPAIVEGFGLPALEALACGAPLITTSGTAMEEVAGNSAILVPPGDEESLAGAIDMVVRRDEGLAARRERGIATAARYTWDASASAHVDAYRSLLEGARRREQA